MLIFFVVAQIPYQIFINDHYVTIPFCMFLKFEEFTTFSTSDTFKFFEGYLISSRE